MSKRARSPVLGYNHNLRYGGRVFHVQTEDSGQSYARLYTHLFFEGTILSSKKEEYDPAAAEDSVRALMQKLHKAMIRELTRGEHDPRIAAFFGARGEPAMLEPRPVVAVAAAPAVIADVSPAVVAAPAARPPVPPVNAKPPAKPVVIVQPTALKRSPIVVSNPAEGVVVRRNVVIDVGAGQPPGAGDGRLRDRGRQRAREKRGAADGARRLGVRGRQPAPVGSGGGAAAPAAGVIARDPYALGDARRATDGASGVGVSRSRRGSGAAGEHREAPDAVGPAGQRRRGAGFGQEPRRGHPRVSRGRSRARRKHLSV